MFLWAYNTSMLQLSTSLLNRPVMSLRTGEIVATVVQAIINPNNLKIEGFYCQDHQQRRRPILVHQDIRDLISQGYVVNDYEVLTDEEDLVRLQEIIALEFNLIGKQVVSEHKKRLGKVDDYATDTSSFFIKKLYVSPPLVRAFTSGQLGIDRNQIIEITEKYIIVQDPMQTVNAEMAVGAQSA